MARINLLGLIMGSSDLAHCDSSFYVNWAGLYNPVTESNTNLGIAEKVIYKCG